MVAKGIVLLIGLAGAIAFIAIAFWPAAPKVWTFTEDVTGPVFMTEGSNAMHVLDPQTVKAGTKVTDVTPNERDSAKCYAHYADKGPDMHLWLLTPCAKVAEVPN